VVETAKKLAAQHGQENLAVQLCVGIILDRAGETEAALELLSKHQGSLDAYVYPEDIAWNWRTHADI
jgi:coatomer protein complex subunit epsilon